MPRRVLLMPLAGVVALLAAACGSGEEKVSSGAVPTRTVEVEMVDIHFAPAVIEVNRGETVEFVFSNTGQLPHDAFIGDPEAQADHARDMAAGHGGHGDSGEGGVTVAPGETGRVVHTFAESGKTEIGCHQPGHYAAGMKIDVTVV